MIEARMNGKWPEVTFAMRGKEREQFMGRVGPDLLRQGLDVGTSQREQLKPSEQARQTSQTQDLKKPFKLCAGENT